MMRTVFLSVIAAFNAIGLPHAWAQNDGAAPAAEPILGQMPIEGMLLNDCDKSVVQCVDKNLKIVRKALYNTTSTVVNWVEEVTTLGTVTETAVAVVIMTAPAQIKGRCEETTVLAQNSTTTIVISVESTSTVEFVPVTTTTTVSTQWVTRDITSQCIVRSTGLPPPTIPTSLGQHPIELPAGSSLGSSAYSSAPAVAIPSDASVPSYTIAFEATPSTEADDKYDEESRHERLAGEFGWESD